MSYKKAWHTKQKAIKEIVSDWDEVYADFISRWNKCHKTTALADPLIAHVTYDNPYIVWYRRITRQHIVPPPVVVSHIGALPIATTYYLHNIIPHHFSTTDRGKGRRKGRGRGRGTSRGELEAVDAHVGADHEGDGRPKRKRKQPACDRVVTPGELAQLWAKVELVAKKFDSFYNEKERHTSHPKFLIDYPETLTIKHMIEDHFEELRRRGFRGGRDRGFGISNN
ncbi:hypothetical protein LguiB_012744 [Lonicera macranthoides]